VHSQNTDCRIELDDKRKPCFSNLLIIYFDFVVNMAPVLQVLENVVFFDPAGRSVHVQF